MQNYVITIARGFGSGGKDIATRLGKELGIPCYERQILTMASDQSGIDESVFVETDEKLYYRRSGGVTVEKDGVLCVPKDGQVEFNTYFNGFSSGKWKKYTTLEQLSLALRLQGNFCVSLRVHWLEKGTVKTKVLTEANVSGEKPEQQAQGLTYGHCLKRSFIGTAETSSAWRM